MIKGDTRVSTLIRLLTCAALLPLAASVEAWHAVGNGGDPLRMVFTAAREHAGFITLRMHPDAFSGVASAEVRAWILANREALSADILASPHTWVMTTEPNCALTERTAAATINLSYATCRAAVGSRDEAAKLLVHESVHHFNVDDEEFADAVADAVYKAWATGVLDWQPLPSSDDVLGARSLHSAVWTGSSMVVFGGLTAESEITNTAARFDPAVNRWTALSTDGVAPRYGHRALVTEDQRMFVWGGSTDLGSAVWQNSGAVLDLASGHWRELKGPRPASSLQAIRQNQTVVWTGQQLIVWGGATPMSATGRTYSPQGGVFDPASNKWTAIKQEGAPFRWSGHTAVWTGAEMIVWGGRPLPTAGPTVAETNEGAIYNPVTNVWRPMSRVNAPLARVDHTAIWTGTKMLVFGGSERSGSIKGSGGLYDPVTDQWTPFISEIATQRIGHTTVWTGDELLIWGGKTREAYYGSVVAFNPRTQNWRAMAVPSTPEARDQHTAVWTGMSMVVFGGAAADRRVLSSGGIFYP